jgi:hypothetical protein
MKLDGERTLPGTPEQIWTMLLDPDVLVSAIPGCEKLEKVGEDHYEGVIMAKVGSIQSQYKTTFKIADKNPPRSYRLNVQGQGSAGFVQADVKMELSPDGSGTRMNYSGEANVGGRIAQVGQRMINATAETMTEKGFDNLHERVQQEVASASPAGTAGTGGASDSVWKRIRSFFKSLRTFLRAFLKGPSSSN